MATEKGWPPLPQEVGWAGCGDPVHLSALKLRPDSGCRELRNAVLPEAWDPRAELPLCVHLVALFAPTSDVSQVVGAMGGHLKLSAHSYLGLYGQDPYTGSADGQADARGGC